MLRPILNEGIGPILFGFGIDNSSGTPSVAEGNVDEVSDIDVSTATLTITPKTPFARSPVIVSNVASLGGLGGDLIADSGKSSFLSRAQDHAGSAVLTTHQILVLGHSSAFTGLKRSQLVRSSNIRPRLIGTKINTTTEASPADGCERDFSVSYASNVATVTFRNPFARPPVVIPTPNGSACAVGNVTSVTKTGCVIKTADSGGNLAGAGISFLALGWDSAFARASARSLIQTSQRASRIFGLQFRGAGTQLQTIGGESATGANGGTGVFTLTFVKAFKRVPILVGVASAGSALLYTSIEETVSGATVRTFNSSAAATDFDNLNVICLGFDEATEY